MADTSPVNPSRVLTGARAHFEIDSQKVGMATGVTFKETIQYEALKVLDSIEIEEYAPTGYEVEFSAKRFRIFGKSLKDFGMPKSGKSSAEHLENILTSGEMTASVSDSKTGKSFLLLEGVRISSSGWTIDAGGVVGEDVTFVARRASDEGE